MSTSPHNPQSTAKRGTDLVYKPLGWEAPSGYVGQAYQSTEQPAGELEMNDQLSRLSGQPHEIHKSGDSRPRFHKESTTFAGASETGRIRPQDAPHTPVPHELRHSLSTARTLCNQLEIANRPVELRVALWLREQILLALLELEGYVEVDSGHDGRSAMPRALEVEA